MYFTFHLFTGYSHSLGCSQTCFAVCPKRFAYKLWWLLALCPPPLPPLGISFTSSILYASSGACCACCACCWLVRLPWSALLWSIYSPAISWPAAISLSQAKLLSSCALGTRFVIYEVRIALKSFSEPRLRQQRCHVSLKLMPILWQQQQQPEREKERFPMHFRLLQLLIGFATCFRVFSFVVAVAASCCMIKANSLHSADLPGYSACQNSTAN